LQSKKKKTAPWIAAFIAAVIAGVIYSLIFPLERWQHFLILGLIMLGVGWLIYVMAQGVDTSRPAPAQKKIPRSGDQTADALVENGQEMLHQIRKENALIPDAGLSAQMEKLDEAAEKIFLTVSEKPACAPRLRRFMDYYLPTTLKMLQGFRKMEERGVSGPEAEAARAQIRSAMDIVIRAFEKQLNHLYQDDMLDISTDIDVLEAMLHQDGLTDSGMDQN